MPRRDLLDHTSMKVTLAHKLMIAFSGLILVVIAASLSGLYLLNRVERAGYQLTNVRLPLQQVLHDLQITLRDAIATSQKHLSEFQHIERNENVFNALLQKSLLLSLALKHGGNSREVGVTKAKIQQLDMRNVPISDNRIDYIIAEIENFENAATAFQEAHRKLASFTFAVEKNQYNIATFFQQLSIDLTHWSAEFADAVKYDLPFRGHRDPATSLFARWRSEYKTNNARLKATLKRYSALEAQIFSLTEHSEQQTAPNRLILYEYGYENYIELAQKLLRTLIDEYTPVLQQIQEQERYWTTQLQTTASRINEYIGELVAAQQDLVNTETQKIERTERQAQQLLVGIVAISIFFAIGAALYLARNIVRPLVQMRAVVDTLAAGETSDISGLDHSRLDEIGELQSALIRFRAMTIESGRRLAEQAEMEQERLQATIAHLPQGLCMFDHDERLVVSNERYAQIYEIDPLRIRPGMLLTEILGLRLEAGSHHGDDPVAYLSHRNSAGRKDEAFTVVHELANGRVIQVMQQPLKGGGWVSTHEDITERRQAETRIYHMARHDALTDLPNRSFLKESIAEGLKRVRRGETMAVLCLDLDRFKAVNDTLGHPIGDQLLQVVAERIRGSIRETDTAARFGGDEFAVLQLGAQQPQGATLLAGRLVETLGMAYLIQDHQLVIGCSVGIAMAPSDSEDAEDLLKKADLALYRAKLDGRGLYRFFETEMDSRVQARRLLELDLRGALANQQFELHYQPFISIEHAEVSGVEALLRWTHPRRGQVSPADFIPLAEETGLIVPIGEWIIRQACKDAATWPEHVRVAVNISPVQFRSASLVSTVMLALASADLPANRLELEITESVLLQDTSTTLATLHQLRALGVRVSMDDFGTGYSSLSYLRSFPFDKIKIDQSFVRDMIGNKQSLAIIQAVTSLGTSLGMATTAEGVETQEQLDQLKANGCTEVQGYYFSKPKPVEEITRHFFTPKNQAKQDFPN